MYFVQNVGVQVVQHLAHHGAGLLDDRRVQTAAAVGEKVTLAFGGNLADYWRKGDKKKCANADVCHSISLIP